MGRMVVLFGSSSFGSLFYFRFCWQGFYVPAIRQSLYGPIPLVSFEFPAVFDRTLNTESFGGAFKVRYISESFANSVRVAGLETFASFLELGLPLMRFCWHGSQIVQGCMNGRVIRRRRLGLPYFVDCPGPL